MTANLGFIEGFYGEPWSDAAREIVVAFIARHGYRFYIYAPKADAYLRKRWREPHPTLPLSRLRALAAYVRAEGVQFGIGLSPYEIYRAFDTKAKAALSAKLALLDEIGVDILAVLFDDMRGDVPDLVRKQCEIVHWIAERGPSRQVILCPSYYTDDPVLDHLFGQRPQNYLEDIGRTLDSAIDVFWTGEEVCAREYSVGHLERVADQLRRKPFLWDNYPVNDGPIMSQYLHLRAFTGRPASLARHVTGHAVNPALQPTLSLIPALTLAESYRLGERYAYGTAFARATETVLGPELGKCVRRDLHFFQDTGLDRLGEKAARLRERYVRFDHPAAREIVAWLDGAWRHTGPLE